MTLLDVGSSSVRAHWGRLGGNKPSSSSPSSSTISKRSPSWKAMMPSAPEPNPSAGRSRTRALCSVLDVQQRKASGCDSKATRRVAGRYVLTRMKARREGARRQHSLLQAPGNVAFRRSDSCCDLSSSARAARSAGARSASRCAVLKDALISPLSSKSASIHPREHLSPSLFLVGLWFPGPGPPPDSATCGPACEPRDPIALQWDAEAEKGADKPDFFEKPNVSVIRGLFPRRDPGGRAEGTTN